MNKKAPKPEEVKGIFSDVYMLYLKYKDLDVEQHEKEVNQECMEIQKKYDENILAREMLDSVLKVLIVYGRKKRKEI